MDIRLRIEACARDRWEAEDAYKAYQYIQPLPNGAHIYDEDVAKHFNWSIPRAHRAMLVINRTLEVCED